MNIDFNKYSDGLVPAIVQDSATEKILMLGFMNQAALEQTQKSGKVTFFSRRRRKLWTKGETSGNFLQVKEILPDCDQDTLLIKAAPAGAICHTGADTCFNETNCSSENFLFELEKIIAERKINPSQDSHVSRLFAKGLNKITQKFGEEAVELIIEAKDENRELFEAEAADMLFHFLILLAEKDISLADVLQVLKNRRK